MKIKLKYSALLFIGLFSKMYGQSVTIIGCGYVGLTLAATLLKKDNQITCFDTDSSKINDLKNKKLPIYEPGLETALFNTQRNGNLFFTNILPQHKDNTIYYICVPTPQKPDSSCDCSFLQSAFNSLVQAYAQYDPLIICIKSTIPPGTMQTLQDSLSLIQKNNIYLFYNPEFMREGSALEDIYKNNPFIIGGNPSHILQKIEDLHTSCINENSTIIKTDYATAELIKYAWNTFSALRITFIHELSYIAHKLDADIITLLQGLSLSENLLPTQLIKPGPPWGGSCLPKDLHAFVHLFQAHGLSHPLAYHVIKCNDNYALRLINTINEYICFRGPVKRVTILGLAFKANTADIRNSPSQIIISELLTKGITVQAYDPHANNEMQKIFPSVSYYNSPYEAIENSDLIIILNDSPEIKNLDLRLAASLCNKKIILDTRALFDKSEINKYGFIFLGK